MIGVTSQIQSDSGGNDGVGFAIPSNTVRTIAAQLVASGKVQHALLGVQVKTASNGNGVAVATVQTGSAAADAGLKAGDVITAVERNQGHHRSAAARDHRLAPAGRHAVADRASQRIVEDPLRDAR